MSGDDFLGANGDASNQGKCLRGSQKLWEVLVLDFRTSGGQLVSDLFNIPGQPIVAQRTVKYTSQVREIVVK
eukprot:9921548-Heterocapsa_arctica.AAC.1